MYSESDLESAVQAGAIPADTAARLRAYVAASRHSPVVDEEHFRLLTGFNDIFVAIAAAILLVAVGWIGYWVGPHIEGDGPTPFMGAFVAAAAWGLAEFFTRKRRMALPSIVLLLAFVGGVAASAGAAIILAVPESIFNDNPAAVGFVLAAAGAVAAGAAFLHWRRFKVPITVAAGAAAVVALLLGLSAAAFGETAFAHELLNAMALAAGIGVFLLAMRWDSSDPRRETRRSDVAFWLHLLAAPLIVHPVFTLIGVTGGDVSAGGAVAVLLLYVAFGLAALAVDRRALLVSALAYVLFALNSLFERFGAVDISVALTALLIGSALLLLSAFWHPVRRAVVEQLPVGLRARLPVVHTLPAAAA